MARAWLLLTPCACLEPTGWRVHQTRARSGFTCLGWSPSPGAAARTLRSVWEAPSSPALSNGTTILALSRSANFAKASSWRAPALDQERPYGRVHGGDGLRAAGHHPERQDA